MAAAATLVATLLARCPGLRVLATSRQPLGVDGELVWAVPALTPPPLDVTPDRLRDFAAARCFLERVEAASGRYPSRDETPVVARLCRRLDGMPLALELAAARTTALSVGQLDDRLSDALHLLTGGPRTSPDRAAPAALKATPCFGSTEARSMVMSFLVRHFTATQGLDGVNWKNGLLETRVMRSSLRIACFRS